MGRLFWSFLFLLTLLVIFQTHVYAKASYVLPYPSVMPGSVFYRIRLLQENLLSLWYFGDFGQFEYNLKQADKYLVEAKTLFEYDQFLLGYLALKKSDRYFSRTSIYIIKARQDGKSIKEKKQMLSLAKEKHIEVLHGLLLITPEVFTWSPEKSAPTKLFLHKDLQESISVREHTI